jgi:hypothetical protein
MTPDTNQATEAQTSNISQLSSGIKQYARQTTLNIMTALSTLVPSATTTMTAVGAGAIAASTMSCEKDEVDPNAIDRTTDNAKHKAEYMSDVKPAILAGGVAKLTFEAVWIPSSNGKTGIYKLKPIPVIDFSQVKLLLEQDAKNLKIPLEKMGLEFFVAQAGGSGGIGYAIPYSLIASKTGEQTMKFEDFIQYIPENAEAKPSVSFTKNET